MATVRDRVESLADRVERERDAYAHGEDRPVGSYAVLIGVYTAAVAGLGGLVRRRGGLPDKIGAGDLALLSIASHKLSRLVTKDSVTAAVRAPFTEFSEPAGSGEVNEQVRGSGMRHAIGELVTCPFCMSMWVATGFAFGLVLAPRATRFAAATLTAVTASDYLQFAHAAMQRAEHDR